MSFVSTTRFKLINLIPGLFILSLSVVAVTRVSSADDYVFTKVTDSDAVGIAAISAAPVIDGDFVVFTAQVPPGIVGEIWSWQISTNTLRKLVDVNTPAPGGVGAGNFTDLNAGFGGPVYKDGLVVFGAKDQSSDVGTAPHHGVYSVPVTGGTISLIANYNTPFPNGGGTFFDFEANNQPAGNFSTSKGVVVFTGDDNNGHDGIYTTDASGGNLTVIADTFHPVNPGALQLFLINEFHNPTIDNGVTLFGAGPVLGLSGIYQVPVASPFSYTNLANSNPAASGGTTLPVLGDQFGWGIPATALVLSGGKAAFIANGRNAQFGHAGIFTVPVGGGAPTKVVTDYDLTADLLPRVVPGSIPVINSFAMDNGVVAFAASDNTGQSQAIFVAQNGVLNRVITNDQLAFQNVLGFPIYNIAGIQPGAVSGGRIVFSVFDLLSAPHHAIYMATPRSQTAEQSLQVVTAPSVATIGDSLTFTLSVTNNGPAVATGVVIEATPAAGVTFVSASSPTTTNGSAIDIALGDIPLGATVSPSFTFSSPTPGAAQVTFVIHSPTIDPNTANNSLQISTTLDLPITVAQSMQALLTQARTYLQTAKKVLPAKPSRSASAAKKKSINAKRTVILNARKGLASTISALNALNAVSGTEIHATVHGFTKGNLKSLGSAFKAARSAESKTLWSNVSKFLSKLGK